MADDQFAEQLLKMPDVAPQERMSEWSPVREGLARIEDAVRYLSANVIAAAGVKPPAVNPAIRPVTAKDRARVNERRAQHLALVARLLPEQP